MSVDLQERMREDRAVRDRAYAVVQEDLDHLKADYQRRGAATRAMDRLKDGADDLAKEAKDVAGEHQGILIALVAAIGLWFVRNPILALFGLGAANDDDDYDDDDYEDYDDEEPGIFSWLADRTR